MMLRKINAELSLATTVLLLDHAIFFGAWMLSKGAIPITVSQLPWVMLRLMMLHAVISIILLIRTYKGKEKKTGKSYVKLNVATIVQRISGVLLVIFTGLHVASASGHMRLPQVIYAIVLPLFFILVMAHVSVSVSKAFVTLGIGNAKFVKMVDVVMEVICGVTLIVDIVGFYLFLC